MTPPTNETIHPIGSAEPWKGLWLALLLAVAWAVPGRAQSTATLDSLYRAHRWLELDRALSRTKGQPLFRGAAAAALNQPKKAEKLLRSVIKAAPKSESAYQAHELLTHLYLQTGRYHQLAVDLKKTAAAFPDRSDVQAERGTLAPFLSLPNQAVRRNGLSSLRHQGDFFLPVVIDGHQATFFFDTGAGISAMGESEAKRLGLSIHETTGAIGTATTVPATFKLAIAKHLSVGGIELKNVSFAVFPDESEPWALLPPGRRGLLGIPVLLAFRELRWARDGSVEIGPNPSRRDGPGSRLYFDEDHLMVTADFQGEPLAFSLDTGAESTDLYSPFAARFPDLIRELGQRDSTEVRGVGRAERFESVSLPDLTFRIGGLETVLRPAHVILRDLGARGSLGNVGADLLEQGRAFRLDFDSMTLELESDR